MVEEGEAADNEEGSTDATTAPAAPLTGWQRLSQTFLNPPGPRSARPQQPAQDLSHLSDDERRKQINQIDATEKKIGLAAGALSIAFTLVYSIANVVSKTLSKPKNGTCPNNLVFTLHPGGAATCNYPTSQFVFHIVAGVIFSAAIFVTAFVGRRALMAFTIVIAGLFFGTFILAVPFIAVGAWLLLRAWRVQRYGSPTAKAPVEGYVPPPPRGTRRPPAERTATRRKRGEPIDAASTERKAPEPSKRYTPKTQKKKRPPPPPE
jgi:hypothetical protein